MSNLEKECMLFAKGKTLFGINKKLSVVVRSPAYAKKIEQRRKLTETKTKVKETPKVEDISKLKNRLFNKEKLLKNKKKFLDDFLNSQFQLVMDQIEDNTKKIEKDRLIAIEMLQNCCREFDNEIKLRQYGSFETGLLTPLSDLDLLIYFNN